MKTVSIIAAAVLSFTGAAFAQGEATYEYPQAVTSAKSRADVQAELQQARAAGLIVSGEASALPKVNFASSASVAEVRALAKAADGALPLHIEAISFDGRALAANTPAAPRVVASTTR